jgi:hypothetical protein
LWRAARDPILRAMLVTAFLILAALLTNDDVVKLTKAGLSAETIVAKIRASETKFDTSTDALVALANAGVPDAVIRAMIENKPHGAAAKRKRIDDVSVATKGGGRCDHAALELTATGLKTTGCHEADVNVAWKDVESVCYFYSFRSTLVVRTAAGERRIHTTSPAELKSLRESIRAFAPKVREETSCR